MTRSFHILIFLLSFLANSLFCQAKMEIKEAKKNSGTVMKGEVLKYQYEISNRGTEPLLIQNIEIGCSCTTTEYDKKPILPGQSSTITVIFDTKSTWDRQDRTVDVVSNDPRSPHKLRYKAFVKKP
jgi:hypothetical protein